MKREFHKLLAMILALIISLAIVPVGSVDAASETTYGGVDYAPVYNCDFYMGYADLKKAFGSNRAKYLEHFVNNGMKEGRQASHDFNVTIYKENYEDLRKAFGNNLKSYYLHYIDHGKSEGRNAVTLISNGGTPKATPVPTKTVTPIPKTESNCNHSYNSTVTIQKATCTTDGINATVCSKCNKELGTRTRIARLGHNYRIVDAGTEVRVECSRCKSVIQVKNLAQFSLYYNGAGQYFQNLSKADQETVEALWLRYNNAGLTLSQTQAAKIIKNRNANASDILLYIPNGKEKRAAEYFNRIEKLSKLSYEKKTWIFRIIPKTETVKPFAIYDQVTGALIGNGYSSFVSDLNRDVKNSSEYTALKEILDKLKKIDGYGTVTYVDKMVDQFAVTTNKAIDLIYQRNQMFANLEFKLTLDDVKDFTTLVDDLDRYYAQCVGGNKFGDKPNEPSHDAFVDYIINRANKEFYEIFGMDIKEASFN